MVCYSPAAAKTTLGSVGRKLLSSPAYLRLSYPQLWDSLVAGKAGLPVASHPHLSHDEGGSWNSTAACLRSSPKMAPWPLHSGKHLLHPPPKPRPFRPNRKKGTRNVDGWSASNEHWTPVAMRHHLRVNGPPPLAPSFVTRLVHKVESVMYVFFWL